MKWSDQELDELATFFAKRMTVDLRRLDPSDPPPPGDPADRWRTKLQQARDRGDLGRLAGKIADSAPDDANLQQACALLTERGGRNTLQVLGAALSVGMLLLLAGTGVAAASLWGVRTAPEPLQPQSVVAAVAEPTPTPDPMSGRMVEGEGEIEAEAPLVAPAAPPAAPQRVAGRCGGEAGAVVGYWYAGEKRPGRKGKTITLDGAVNVRADYPDVHNQFQKRAAVKCVLQAGDRVKLEQAPIKVPGDAFWVPLVAGSVESSKA